MLADRSKEGNAFYLLYAILRVFFVLRQWKLETSWVSLRLLKITGSLCQDFVSFTSCGNKKSYCNKSFWRPWFRGTFSGPKKWLGTQAGNAGRN